MNGEHQLRTSTFFFGFQTHLPMLFTIFLYLTTYQSHICRTFQFFPKVDVIYGKQIKVKLSSKKKKWLIQYLSGNFVIDMVNTLSRRNAGREYLLYNFSLNEYQFGIDRRVANLPIIKMNEYCICILDSSILHITYFMHINTTKIAYEHQNVCYTFILKFLVELFLFIFQENVTRFYTLPRWKKTKKERRRKNYLFNCLSGISVNFTVRLLLSYRFLNVYYVREVDLHTLPIEERQFLQYQKERKKKRKKKKK